MPRGRTKFSDISLSKGVVSDAGDAQAGGTFLAGTPRDERLEATSDADWWIEGRGGSDLITGAGGDDLLVAGRALQGDGGTDGDPDTDDAIGVRDVPSLTSAPLRTTIDGGGGDDLVVGAQGDDQLRGGDGDDWLLGLDGADDLSGGDGDDLLMPGLGAATLQGVAGIDTVSWADLPAARGRGALPGVVLNLSDRLIRYESGDQLGEGRILVQASSGGFVLLGEADTTRGAPRSAPGGRG